MFSPQERDKRGSLVPHKEFGGALRDALGFHALKERVAEGVEYLALVAHPCTPAVHSQHTKRLRLAQLTRCSLIAD